MPMNGLMRAMGFALPVGLSLAGLLVYSGQQQLLYPAPPFELPEVLPPGVEKIDLATGYGLLLEPDSGSERPLPLLIYAHGNGEVAFWWTAAFEALLARGIAVLLVEYPGYGGAGGSPNSNSIEKTMLAAYDTMAARGDIDSGAIVAYGRSLGGAAVSLLAAERQLAALCLESTFSSLPALVREKGWPAFLLRDRFDNLAIVRSLDIPVFLYHGTQDTLIPIAHSERLAAASQMATFIRAGCGHNNCPRPWPALIAFLDDTVFD